MWYYGDSVIRCRSDRLAQDRKAVGLPSRIFETETKTNISQGPDDPLALFTISSMLSNKLQIVVCFFFNNTEGDKPLHYEHAF